MTSSIQLSFLILLTKSRIWCIEDLFIVEHTGESKSGGGHGS